jgi:hypothetical protein
MGNGRIRPEKRREAMWKPETILMFVNTRRQAAEYDRRSLSARDDDQALMRRSEAAGEQHAFARLAARLEGGDNPYRMLAKIQEVKDDAPSVLSEDYIATFQYAQACGEVTSLIRGYLDHVEWNVSGRASFCLL